VVDARDDNSGRVGLIGKTLGRYRITAELGRGGMATVYRAFDPQLGREVAVKVMHGTFTGRGDIEKRFRREAQAVAATKHASIVDIFDFAPGGDGEPGYIVTEIIEGPTLRQLMNDCGGRLLPEVATAIGVRVASALGAAHSHGIIHRDVKPDNVMIDCRPGAAVRVLLTDFGVARIVEDDTMTATGSILGSPAYMSPEQARGHDVGKPSDVFSLGALLYHLVTGRPPFPGKDPLTVIASILGGEIPRPGQLAPHVGPALEAVIMRCLKRAPEDRYADASAVHAALRTVFQEARGGGDSDSDSDGDPLRMFFDDRDAFTATLKMRVAGQAYENARLCVRRGDLTRALAEVNRTFAYQPGHGGAEALLGRITARRRWSTVGKVAAALVLLAGGGAAAAKLITARRATTAATMAASPAASPSPIVAAQAPEAPVAKVLAVTAAGSSEKKLAATVSTDVVAPARKSAIRRPASARGTAARAARTPVEDQPTAIGTPPTVTENAPPPIAATTTPVAPIAPPPANSGLANASLVIRASEGFCSPSVDQQPAKIRPVYEHIAPGSHQIFCTMPGGAKHLAGTYELLPGTRPNLVVVPGPDGTPVLARPQ
jgi:serine/threonine-protein kinase